MDLTADNAGTDGEAIRAAGQFNVGRLTNMMKNYRKSVRTRVRIASLCLVLVVLGTPAFASEEKLRLVCSYSYTWNIDKNERGDTIGEVVFVINRPTESGVSLIMAHGETTRLFVRTQTEVEVNGVNEWGDESVKLKEELKINRYTGGFSIGFSVNGKLGLIHDGECRATDKPKF